MFWCGCYAKNAVAMKKGSLLWKNMVAMELDNLCLQNVKLLHLKFCISLLHYVHKTSLKQETGCFHINGSNVPLGPSHYKM